MSISQWIWPGLAALALLPATARPLASPPALAQVLHASRWRQRLLLIGAPTAGAAGLQRQRALLAAVPTGLAERDFRVIDVPYDQLSPADRQCWTQQLGQPLGSFVVVLIGKDGGVKQASAHPLAPADLFATVDKMPMRRQEMRASPSR